MSKNQAMVCNMLVVKIAGRCNINCSYCYMYNKGDMSYLKQPKKMHETTVIKMMERVREHCLKHSLSNFYFALHGGEPLLAGKEFFRLFTGTARKMLQPEITPSFSVQTNAVLLDDEWCSLLAELNIGTGISLDGSREIHDMYRLDFNGNGTYDRVIAGLKTALKPEYTTISPGILSVLNLHADSVENYEHFRALGCKSVDILLPDNTHDSKPPSENTPYADWLIQVFDKWFFEKEENRLSIRLFEFITGMILGRDVSFDHLGSGRNELLVVETDGGIEAVDVLKVCGDSFTKAGANVRTHTLDDAMQTQLAGLFHLSHERLCKKCSVCPVKEVCGGGYIPHRYSSKNGFNNPSVYCNDLLKLITHIQNVVFSQMPQGFLEEMGVDIMSYEEAKALIEAEMILATEPDYVAELEQFQK